jgi:NADPH-dependent 2,4-dienoyl-CoA reductase/sulfur reductase-like enzyme
MAYVKERRERTRPQVHWHATGIADSVVIVAGGAAGNAAAETLRREGYSGQRPTQFYNEHKIDLRLGTRVAAIDIRNGHVEMAHGAQHTFDALVLATGSEPVRLDVPGAGLPHMHYLRTVTDSRSIISRALASRRAVVIAASFIGLEVAASLRIRNIDVHVVGREAIPDGADPRAGCRKIHPQAP